MGVLNQSGQLIPPMQYEEVKLCDEPFGIVKKDNVWGIIDAQGQEVLPFIFEDIRCKKRMYNAFVSVLINGQEFYLNNALQCVKDCPDAAVLVKYGIK